MSESTRQDAVDLLHLDPARIHVVPLGVGPVFSSRPKLRDARVAEALGLDEPYVLWVGSLRGAIHARGSTRCSKRWSGCRAAALLGLVGALGPEADRLAADAWRRHVRIVLCGPVDDTDLASLYRQAAVVVLPVDA